MSVEPPPGLARVSRDPAELRRVFGTFATGVTVLTAHGTEPCGMTANSFASVSLDPALALVCVKPGSAVHEAAVTGGGFAVSVLSAEQEDLARHFADNDRPRGEKGFAGVTWRPGRHTRAPLIEGGLGWLECALATVHDAGDHAILVGSVLECGLGPADGGLLFFRGRFGNCAEPPPRDLTRGPLRAEPSPAAPRPRG
ncbi:flavin reductase family protein [Actinacidiphila yeochonensis]|uniref:flavin reductase family protein n=1 Tax=Actinacidiphila yeochonensis TaxID=89050 RepID=UPI0007C69782|nr:flavin reductase family protein [Actinacidiphila yeochonensis]